jgi:ribose-phosphate pyrophosphokinase
MMKHHQCPIVLGLPSYLYLARPISRLARLPLGAMSVTTFPDGEHYIQIPRDLRNRDVVLVGGTVSDADTLTLYDTACGIVSQGARSLTLMMPYFGYATMERAANAGDVVTAKTRAQLFSSIASAGVKTEIVLLDLHADGIAHYFESNVQTVHLHARHLVLAAARRMGGKKFVLACTDAGRAKWVESLANELGVAAAFVFKRYDDMIRTGSSLIKAATALKSAGARRMDAITTHGLFPGDALERIAASGLFQTVVCTDSHPRARQMRAPWLKVQSVAKVFATHLIENGLGRK